MKTLFYPAKFFATLLAISCTFISTNIIAQNAAGWSANPFDQRVFIENKGQFDNSTDDKNVPVHFGATVEGQETYFTATGVCYEHGEVILLNERQKDSMIATVPNYVEEKNEREEHSEKERYHFSKVVPRFLKMEWVGCNPNAHVETEGLVSNYFTYPKDKSNNSATIIAQAYKKITYQNMYPNIDIEYIIPNDKDGIKYSLILHPGADLSVVKMKYSYAEKVKQDNDGNIVIQSSFGDFIDHAPTSFYQENNEKINTSFELNKNIVSFNADNYNSSKEVIVDPWTTNPVFPTWDRAYDVVYDKNGNVWAYGGAYPWHLTKFSPAGAILWTYIAAAMYNSGCCTGSCYGDVAVDETSGSCYLSEGFDFTSGSRVFKVNTAGVQTAASVGNPNFNEIWRMEYNRCINVILGAGGGTSGVFQGIKIDTTFAVMTPVNSYNAISNTDNWGISIDPTQPWLYMCTVNPSPNPMIRVPVPALAPFSWNTNSGFTFSEISSALYVTNGCCANGYNGMSASLNWLYMTDGSVLKKVNKGTGAIVATTPTGGTIYASGGTSADICDNVYVGIGNQIKEYSPALALITTIAAAGTIYDVKLGPNNGKIYASGDGFVSQLTVPISTVVTTMTSAPSSNCVCNGSATGNITICGLPAPTVTYSWVPGNQTTQTVNGLCAGLYTCYFTAACNEIYHDTITVHAALSSVSLASTQVNVSCNGQCNGSINVTPSGGTAPYTYVWSPAVGTGVNASNLCAGTYTCTVTDALACTGFTVITITQPPILTATATQVNILCNGSCTGSSTVTAGGGTPGYTYVWTPSGGNAATATGLCAGTYTCTVTDTKGCTKQAIVTITQPPVLTATSTQVNILCNGACTGSSTVTAGGGTPAYTYAWTPSGGNTATATGLCAGTYTCTVTDANGCTKQAIVTITQPTVLTATTTQVNVSCNGGCNGTSTVTAGGGTPAYTYVWTPSGGNAATGTGLCAGNYTVTVTDANGCTKQAFVTITQPPVLTVTTTMTQSTCSASNGTATATATGGTPAYTYVWAPSAQTNATATGLGAGSYTVTVTDSKGCTATSIIVITSAAGGTASISASTNVLCFGGNTGSASVTVVGGTAPYTYVWSPSGGNTANATGLTAGTYTVTVTDANGCVTSATVVITQPTLLTSSTTQVNILCNGSCTGTSTVTAAGGTAPYAYVWNPSGQATATATGLCAGNYTCTTTDAHGCIATSTVTITQPPALTSTTTQVNVSCNGGCNGTSTVTAGGGNPPYTYAWSPSGGNAATATGLCAGSYTCTITDANGCFRTSVVTITQPTALVLTTTTVNAVCGQPNGSATVTATGGTPAYTYVWNPSAQTNANATGLAAGNYTVTVTDANGCILTATATVVNAGAPTVTIVTTTNVTCFGLSNGSITTNTTGGSAPYTYAWSPTGGNAANATGLGPNTYTITVTDANGCTTTASATITQPPLLTSSITASVNVLCFGGNNGSATVTSVGGTPAYTYAWAPTGGNAATATGLTAGTYTVTTTDANGCVSTSTIVITQPTQLVIAVAGFNATCSGSCNGQAVCIPSGGTSGYSYSWAPSGGSNPSATGLCAGIYTVFVTDANGCQVNDTAIVNQPITVTATTTQVNVLCNGSCTGTATVTAAGGTTPYTYNWNTTPNQNTATATGLCAGNYTVVVTDFNGCTVQVVVTITQPPALTATTTQVNILCNGTCNGSATVTAGGGNPAYTYSWNTTPAQLTATATGLCVGNYTVYVTDANGCIITAPVTITQPPVLTVAAAAAPGVICIGNSSTLTAVGGGGNPAYTFVWNPGNINGISTTVSPTTTTTYTVTITDANGCTDTNAITVTVNPLPVITFTSNPSPAIGCAPLCVDFNNTTPNSTSCFWNFGNTATSNICNPTYCYTVAGTYDVTLTVVDNNGCQNSLTMPAYVIVYPVPVADFSFSPQPTTMLNGQIQFTDLSQGNPNQWTWSFGDINNSGSNLQNPSFTYTDSGSYDVQLIVVTQFGCRDTIDKIVRIDPDFVIYVPNAFTPGGNTANNTFYPKGTGIDENRFKMWIFDRWGNMIWYTEKWGKGWDGHANDGSDIAQIDVYVWKIEVYDFTGMKHQYIGHVSLIK